MREWKGLGARLLFSTIKPVAPYLQYAYGKQDPRGPLFTRSGDLYMCGSQTDWNTARILVFLDNL